MQTQFPVEYGLKVTPKYTDMLVMVYFALCDAKVWRWGSKPTPVPNANSFASQWNIGLRKMLRKLLDIMGKFRILDVGSKGYYYA